MSGRQTIYLQWLKSQQNGTTQLIPVDSVVYLKADHKYTSVVTATDEHLIRTSQKYGHLFMGM